MSSSNDRTTLTRAVNDSAKDYVRRAESLNAIRQRLALFGENNLARLVSRFQNQTDRPYTYRAGAAAVHSIHTYSDDVITTTDTSGHPFSNTLSLIVIKGESLMPLVHALYERAANEA